jgi:hypothetical protein
VIKSIWIGLKFGMVDQDSWYKILYKFYENWIRDDLVLEYIMSDIVQQFLAYSSGVIIEIW